LISWGKGQGKKQWKNHKFLSGSLPPNSSELNRYAERTGKSKTGIVIQAITEYLDRSDRTGVGERLSRLEKGMEELLEAIRDIRGEQN
jgi:hypothetical protein